MEQTALDSTDGTSQGVVDAMKILLPLVQNLLEEGQRKGIKFNIKISYPEDGYMKFRTHEIRSVILISAEQVRDLEV